MELARLRHQSLASGYILVTLIVARLIEGYVSYAAEAEMTGN